MYAKSVPSMNDKENITMTCFIPFETEIDDYDEKKERNLLNRAISGTSKGRIIIWDEDQFSDLENEQNKRSVLKIIDLSDKSEDDQNIKKKINNKSKSYTINIVSVIDKYIVVGSNDGKVCF